MASKPGKSHKLKDFWRNCWAITFCGFVLLCVGLLLYATHKLNLLHCSSNFGDQSKEWWEIWSDRASILNLYVDIVGFALAIVAGLIAAHQFQEARKAAERIPDLRIEEELEGSSIVFEPSKSITLMVKNDGKGVAQHFLVQIEVPTAILAPSYYDPQPLNSLPALWQAFTVSGEKYWRYKVTTDEGLIRGRYYNQGDFPCFDKDQIPLAEFQLDYRESSPNTEGRTFYIRYSIQSEKMKRKDGEIEIVC